ncbi:MAG: heparinase II/III family protein, partial [Clostridiales bacterium]|nr:heparinase II/III family protein [Clostridiales bacterium]
MSVKKLLATFMAAAIVASVIPSELASAVYADARTDVCISYDLDGLESHTKKVYDGFENIGGYARPSAQTILNDYQRSSTYGVHPRIMITSSKVSQLKKEVKDQNNPKSWWYNKLESRGRQLCNQLTGSSSEDYLFKYTKCYETRMPGVGGSGVAADQFRDRMMILGMMYQLTGETKYADAAWVMISRVASFPDINPWHDLDFGIFCQGYAIAYDWMYNAWSNDRRTTLEEAIKRQCFRPANDSFTNNSPSKSQTSDNGLIRGVFVDQNHNPFVNSGIIMTSLALMDKYPKLTSSLCHDAFICLEKDLNMFAPDGVTKEGMEYMLHTIDNLSFTFSSMETSIGKLYGLDTCPGFVNGKVMRAVHGMESDAGAFSFSDTYDTYITGAGELYFDSHYDLHGFRQNIYDRLKDGSGNDYTKNVMILCWYVPDSSTQTVNIDRDMHVGGDAEFATFRSVFEAKQSFVGVKAGKTVREYFVHMDQGSFVYHALGVKWAVDMGKDNYDLPGYMKPSESDNRRFKIFRLRPDAHNVLLIDPSTSSFGYEFNKKATITTESTDDQAKAIVDMTELQSAKASSAKRGFLLTDDRLSLVVRDEVELKGTSDLYWVMYTPQNASVSGNTVTLSAKNNASIQVKLEFLSSVNGELYTERATPWSLAPTVSGQNSNDSYTRIVYKIKGASGSVNITAKFTPVTDATTNAANVSSYGAISTWNLGQSSQNNN